jgi:ATP-grasp in the biosynthetic pathway with Ter operon
MNKITTVLVFPCGAESALEIHHALKDVMNIRLVGASGKEDHGRMVFKNYYSDFPNITEDDFFEKLNSLIAKEKIDIILPTHDSVLVKFAQNLDKINTIVAVPGLRQAEICRSKKKIYELFQSFTFCPKVYPDELRITKFPAYAKLDEGQGSKGAFVIHNNNEVAAIKDPENYVFMEFLPGEEITIDCFTDRHSEVKFVGPRVRKRVMDGVSVNSHTISADDEVREIAKIVSDQIGIRGSWYFQLKRNESGKWRLLEASVKVAGNMNVYRGLGVNFPLLMVYDYLDFDVEIIPNTYQLEIDRALNHRYIAHFEYDTIYIDFDDTITKNEAVNPAVISFLYYQKNKGRKIHLITKHQKDLDITLENLVIHKGLFDSIIHIPMDHKKSEYIKEGEKVIFIDNAFGERLDVAKKLGIPVFDVDAINTLIDYRE